MKMVLVQFHEKGNSLRTLTQLLVGKDADSKEAFVELRAKLGVEVVVHDWWEIPADMRNAAGGEGDVRQALEALIALDALAETPVVSDLIATIFHAGIERHLQRDFAVQSAFRAGQRTVGK